MPLLAADTVLLRWMVPAKGDGLAALLDDEERARAGRFHFPEDRDSYVAAHALLRVMLSAQVAEAPSAWRFVRNAHGKPEPCLTDDAPPLRVNLSHTRGLVAVALSVGHDVGVDVEARGRKTLTLELANRFFAAPEVEAVRAASPDQRDETLIAIWTLKEAVVKALGQGLALSLRSFSVTVEPPTVRFGTDPDPAPGWLLRRPVGHPEYALAVALRHPAPEAVTLDVAEVTAEALLAAGTALTPPSAGP